MYTFTCPDCEMTDTVTEHPSFCYRCASNRISAEFVTTKTVVNFGNNNNNSGATIMFSGDVAGGNMIKGDKVVIENHVPNNGVQGVFAKSITFTRKG